jgi:hypothetical protein
MQDVEMIADNELPPSWEAEKRIRENFGSRIVVVPENAERERHAI